jgi:hypothetical protein
MGQGYGRKEIEEWKKRGDRTILIRWRGMKGERTDNRKDKTMGK